MISQPRNYFVISYIYGTYVIVILSTAAISPHLLPISFYLINKKTSNYFKEWDLFIFIPNNMFFL